MGIPGSANPLLLASAAGSSQYTVSRSLRFNSSDSAYLSRTPSSVGNRKTWTWSGWVKRSTLSASTRYALFGSANAPGTSYTALEFYNDTLRFLDTNSGGTTEARITAAVYRDTSAWMHVVLAYDTTQATAANRIKLYVNGSEVTAFTTSSNPSQNSDAYLNQALPHALGSSILSSTPTNYFSGYLADIHFIDGQALTPSSFTEVSATTGQLVPKAYTGSYGTNGFKLDFADNSAATAAALGKDTSGNGNNWTPNNLSVTAGAGNDSLVDTPTSYGTDTGAGGEVRGNYATLNAVAPALTNLSYANGNLEAVKAAGTNDSPAISTVGVSSGKWYWEVVWTSITGAAIVGITDGTRYAATLGAVYHPGRGYQSDTGNKIQSSTTNPSASGSSYGATWAANDVIGVALDADAGSVTFYKNGVSQGSAFSSLGWASYFPQVFLIGTNNAGTAVCNFGQRPFAYTAPSGFKALCDTNLPAPVVAKPSTLFDTKLYTGNGSTQTISGLGMSPDLVWIKARNAVTEHVLADTVRGANLALFSNLTNAETSATNLVTGFTSDGFSVGANGGTGNTNVTYVGWCWDAGSSNSTNTQGSITSTVRANASAGFSIVTWTGNGATSASVGHGLGVAPRLYLTKCRDSIGGALDNWGAFTTATGSMSFGFLNTTAAFGAPGQTAPTSSTINVVSGFDNVSGKRYVAYCFAPVAGYSSMSSFAGNGSSDGVFVYTGFRPRWLMIKRSNSTSNWTILDATRGAYNVNATYLDANVSDAERSDFNFADFLSNGFKLRATNATWNTSGGTYIYAAFAESPFQYARAR